MHSRPIFDADVEGETLIVSLTSNISSFADSELRRELQGLLDSLRSPDIKNLVIDFGHVPYFGSTMLEAVLTLGKEVQERGKMVLCNVSNVGLEILQVCEILTQPLARSLRIARQEGSYCERQKLSAETLPSPAQRSPVAHSTAVTRSHLPRDSVGCTLAKSLSACQNRHGDP